MTRAVPLPVEPARITALESRGERLFYLVEPTAMMVGDMPGERLEQQRLARTEAAGQQGLVAPLRLQLNPHFVFNTLNTISALIGEERSGDAQQVILKLAAFRAGRGGLPAEAA